MKPIIELNRPGIEVVVWTDAYGCSTEWTLPETLVPSECLVESVGRVIHETDKHIVIAPHTQPETSANVEESVCGEMTIPKVCIVSRQKLRIDTQ